VLDFHPAAVTFGNGVLLRRERGHDHLGHPGPGYRATRPLTASADGWPRWMTDLRIGCIRFIGDPRSTSGRGLGMGHLTEARSPSAAEIWSL
jgi:hypothetical protein